MGERKDFMQSFRGGTLWAVVGVILFIVIAVAIS
jgi:hypothetical protein